MNPRSAKAKGRQWENEIVDFLIEAGWPHAERRRLAGFRDKGDIAGIAGVVIEAKAARTYTLPAWLRETEVERVNAGASIGACWVKRNGKACAKDGMVVMSPVMFLQLLREAGYGGTAPAVDIPASDGVGL